VLEASMMSADNRDNHDRCQNSTPTDSQCKVKPVLQTPRKTKKTRGDALEWWTSVSKGRLGTSCCVSAQTASEIEVGFGCIVLRIAVDQMVRSEPTLC